MDYELWGKFLLAGAKMEYTGIPFGFFRLHDGQKTQDCLKQTESMLNAATALVASADSLSPETKREILSDLQAYREAYPKEVWKGSGRLAKLGLPPSLVRPLRNLRNVLEKTLTATFGAKES